MRDSIGSDSKNQTMKRIKHNCQGFEHVFVMVMIAVVVAVGGTFLLVASHADPVSHSSEHTIKVSALQAAPGQKPPTTSGLPYASGVTASAASADTTLRHTIWKVLDSQLGVKETPNNSNCTPHNIYRNTCQQWCAYFASWVWQHAGIKVPTYGYTGDFVSWAPSHYHPRGQYSPHTGDLVIFQNDEHTGIVSYSSNGKIAIVAGNYGNQVASQVSQNHSYVDYPSNFYVQDTADYGSAAPKYYIAGFVTPD
jgi:hypothetical protein